MAKPIVQGARSRLEKPDASISFGFIAIVLFFIGSGWISYWNTRVLDDDSQRVVHTQQVIASLDELLSVMKDAETGQRGYLITGEQKYLEPYTTALTNIDSRIADLQHLTESNAAQTARIHDMKARIRAKLQELATTIALRRDRSFDAARTEVLTDRGKSEMDALRIDMSQTQREELARRDVAVSEMASAYRNAIVSGLLTVLVGIILAVGMGYLVQRASHLRQREKWLQTGQVGLSKAIFGEERLDQIAEKTLKFLGEYLDAHAGAFYAENGNDFRLLGSYGVPQSRPAPDRFTLGDGLLGQTVKDNRTILVQDAPDGYLTVGSALGQSAPRHLIISPATVDGMVNAVVELGFIQPLDDLTVELLERIGNPIGIAVRSAMDRSKLQDLLEETQRQGEELQTQSEELRVSNEELAEQTHILRESQAQLEQQQVELEQTNVQLEEQTQALESQRDDLNRTKEDLESQAADLERTSRFKSEFLANMSHELRTPLNSSLILAKLLGDNRTGNLSEEQVKYARTIESAGNDLLTLISDILDLSKIEAGHMEVRAERLWVESIVSSMARMFEPIATQRSLKFGTVIAHDVPEFIESDPQRLEQILKNLLSNAMKFTEIGEVTLSVRPAERGFIAFSVIDTGIGIGPQQHEMVFEAFRQADGTTNRRYGGTGLGLSISRELAHLLGGEVTLESEQGKGSTFTLTIPEVMGAGSSPVPQAPLATTPAVAQREAPRSESAPVSHVPDDRGDVTSGSRSILVVEDDEHFARLMLDLAHEVGFKCLVATTAREALSMASQYLPSAVLLDIGLPDSSGLSVLDRLKHDDRTRHIPVHVVSGSDYERTAMSLGAVGYMLKPVKREELVGAFTALEERLSQSVRRVLVVEDDPVQLDSMQLLLGSLDVEVVGVGSAAECLEVLQNSSFDCMVLDLTLPDASGLKLLETADKQDGNSFPPVIVYTGRELTADEEHRLGRYSKSIIVKGAKSPERLLDEVTLFLHQVVADLPDEKRRLIEQARNRDADLENRRILIVEDDVRNVFALSSILEPRGAKVEIARNGREALDALERSAADPKKSVDLVLMDIMMPEMDGLTAMRIIRGKPEFKKLPIIALTAKAMKNDQEECLQAGANDYISKPLDVEKLLSLTRVWMPRD